MKLKSITIAAAFLIFINVNSNAQRFMTPLMGFSKDKTSYLFKSDGKEIKCNLKGLKWKKGLIEEIKIVNLSGKKVKISPEDITHMYLPPNGLAKLSGSMSFLTDASKWDNKELRQDIISKGYIYHESSKAKIKKKTGTYMLQLLNPSFSSMLKVYYDPFAKETMSAGVGPVKLAGGLAKSYYIKKTEDEAAYLIEKKLYKTEFSIIFKDCPALIAKYKDAVKWSDFEAHVFEYGQLCK